jgi:DNA-binding response OmpR family regulator
MLDVMMPGIAGFEVLETIRHTSDVPIIMLTAKGQEPDRVKGFQKGCDDYVVKPFSPRELIQRVKVLLRRIYNQGDEIIHVNGNLRLYEGSKVVLKGDNQIELSSVEFRLLYALLMHKNQILTREQLIRLSFGDEYEGYDRNIDTYVKRLRNKIEDNPKEPKFIKTKYGQGYKFEGDSHES